MHVITTCKDIKELQATSSVPSWLLDIVTEEFQALHQALSPEVNYEEFSLTIHGPIAILEAGDVDLSAVGLLCSLTETWPEFVEKVILHNKKTYYRSGVMLDNEYILLVFALKDDIDSKTKEWLDEQADVVEGGAAR